MTATANKKMQTREKRVERARVDFFWREKNGLSFTFNNVLLTTYAPMWRELPYFKALKKKIVSIYLSVSLSGLIVSSSSVGADNVTKRHTSELAVNE